MFRKITREKLEKFLEKYSTDVRVLDIGSGGSAYGKYFPNRISIDIDPLRNPDIVGDAHKLPFKDGEFEIILCTEVLEHLTDPRLAISEMRRVLAKDGTLILTTRFVYPIHDSPGDYWRFTRYGLEKLFSDWKIVELKAETENFSTIAVLLQRICYQSNLKLNKPIKFLLFFVASMFNRMNFLIKSEYGDIKKSTEEKNIMPSGYYIVCNKK